MTEDKPGHESELAGNTGAIEGAPEAGKKFKEAVTQELVNILRQTIPDLTLETLDYGFTVIAGNPTTGRMAFLVQTFRPERDGAVGQKVMTKESADDLLRILCEPPAPAAPSVRLN